ncbi:HoxN/HupN/NixA family nickel/cobalt transporter [Gigaspora margarita]|uniref:Nickel/cobalt efflux system n=1 Tax=Gigaspora margarita TaxID=4874 RepID=A0A8H4B0Z0_GIGMA|nr:HoxN/HupN/NixA family nickel/cobalt transporter [Gigaspora margarita]
MSNNETIQDIESSISSIISPTTLIENKNNNIVKRKAIIIITILVLINITTWVIALLAFKQPSLLGSAALAYTLGLRHAVDADHLAAIDNVTRKLLYNGNKSVSVGFFFSLGHSTILILCCLAVSLTATAIKENFGDIHLIGGYIGNFISATFLFVIGIMNAFVLISIYRSLKNMRKTGSFNVDNLDININSSGCMGKIFSPMFKFVDSSWKMYPLGVLFGFAFDTSTEVALLGIAAFRTHQNFNIWLIMIFPLLFTSGMALIDTLDGILMLETYSWALINPVRKLYYNFTITLLSVIIAFVIGFIEFIDVIGNIFNFDGPFWDFFDYLNDHFFTIGCAIIGSFVITWCIAKLIYKFGGYETLEKSFIQQADNNNNNNNNSEKCDSSTTDESITVVAEITEIGQEVKVISDKEIHENYYN